MSHVFSWQHDDDDVTTCAGCPGCFLQVLREQLGPGELDAAARVCKAWAAQLAHDVVHCEMCMPASHEQLLCQLEQLGRRFRNVGSWHLWLPAGADWAAIDDQRLLWLLSRYVVLLLCCVGSSVVTQTVDTEPCVWSCER
jgi:hypothetical protein